MTIGSHTTFEKPECEAYFNVLMSLDPRAQIVEVGLEYGRSSSIALQVAKDREHRYIGIDPFGNDERAYDEWNKMRNSIDVPVVLFRVHSADFPAASLTIDAILIDGDHDYEGVLADCLHFLPYVRRGGYVMFHDYMRDSLPDVTRAVERYIAADTWKWVAVDVIGTLGIWRRK
jgi:cephalosporin hydroxylase